MPVGVLELVTNCQTAGSSAFSNVARVDLNGGPFNGNKGLAADINVTNVYLRPAFTGDNWILHVMYAADAALLSQFQEYIEFGWRRSRTVFGYDDPHARIIHTVPGPGQTVYDLGVIATGVHRFKLFFDVNASLWRFYIDDVLRKSLSSPSLGSYNYFFSSTEVTDSCNGAKQTYGNTWRFSTLNDEWIKLGQFGVSYNVLPQYDTNNHYGGAAPNGYTFNVACNSGHGCKEVTS